MSDQADTLRRMMLRQRAGEGAMLPRDTAVPACTIHGAPGAGKTILAGHLGAALARSGLNVLIVDRAAREGVAGLAEGLGVAGQTGLIEVESRLWYLARETEFGEGAQELMTALAGLGARLDLILLDSALEPGTEQASAVFNGTDSIFVLDGGDGGVEAARSQLAYLRKEVGMTQTSVIVNRVTDGAHAQKELKRLREAAGALSGVQLEYLAHFPNDEKITQGVSESKILLDWNERALSVRCLELLVKRFREKHLGMPESTVGPGGFKRPLAVGRFREEPARRAPRTLTRLWRALLGEVEA